MAIDNTIDTSVEFTPQNPFTIDIPTKEGAPEEPVAYPGFAIEPEKTGFIKTAIDQFKEDSSIYHIFHIANAPLAEPANLQVQYLYPEVNDKFYHPAPPGWSPKQEIEKLSNTLDPRFIPKLLATKNPDDFKYQLDSINEESTRTKELQNGSAWAKLFGGTLGLTVGSIEMLVPMAAIATKVKVADGFFSAALRSSPGILGAAAIHEGAAEMDKVEGNLSDFIKDTFIDSVFGVTFFGGVGAVKSLINISELNRLKKFARDSLDGIGYNFKVDKKGVLQGFEAVDTTGGSVSAAKVTRAQEHADAAFYKGGLFKIPYVGTGVLKLISGNVSNDIPGLRTVGSALQYLFGSPLIQLKISDYPAANAFADAAFDHFITTEGEAKGGVRPPSFEQKVKQTRAMLTALKAQTKALHAEMNGYTITARPAIDIQNAWSSVKQKTIETLSKESKSTDWSKEEDFMDMAQRVMFSGKQSEYAPVNELAAIYRKIYDDTGHDYLKAHNLPKDYFRNMETYISRVYDTVYMNANETGENGWIPVISKYFADSDAIIEQKMQPINTLKQKIKDIKKINPKDASLPEMREQLKQIKENLQNELRNNPEHDYYVEDRLALSADEANELKGILKPLNELKKQFKIEKDKVKRDELRINIQDEEYKLYDAARHGKINARFYNPLNFKLRDPKDRLKFRKVFNSQMEREITAKAAYNSIMQMNPEDIISDVFGHIMGIAESNPLKKRTLMVPDEILYNNNFLTKDLYSKTANYVNFLSKRTHLKNSFNNITVNGNFEELAGDLLADYEKRRDVIHQRIAKLTDPKKIKRENKKLDKEAVKFNDIKNVMKQLFETRMMGVNKRSDFDNMARRTLMSVTSAVNLHNVLAMQIGDVGFAGFQHGIWPSVRDGIYPMMESLGGILKTKDAEALRKMAPHVHLGLQDMLNNYADRNWHSELQPYLNMGKIVSGIEKVAHFSALADLTPYTDNGLQRLNGSIIQSNFMEFLHKHVEGKLSEKESLYLRKYGIDPEVWASRMVKSYEQAGGFKTKLGGYMSKAWQWQDLEASNVFSDSVFRGIQNSLVFKGMADSPFFADTILGLFYHTFTGWTYAATNRYLIPALQHPDGEMLLKMMWMMGAGALVSPFRRISRGEDPWPDDMTPEQIAFEAFSDGGLFSSISGPLNLANFMTNDKLLGDLKNDKFRNRIKSGIFGMNDVISSTATRISDVLGMVNSGLNEKDLKTAAHMSAITGSMYGHYIGDKFIEERNLPRNKRAAEQENN